MCYCSLPISYRWGQTNKNSIGGDRRTKFNRLGQTNKSSIGGDRRTEVQRYKKYSEWERTIFPDEHTGWGRTIYKHDFKKIFGLTSLHFYIFTF